MRSNQATSLLVETDKATMELESYEDGTLLYIGVEAGNSVEIDGLLPLLEKKVLIMRSY